VQRPVRLDPELEQRVQAHWGAVLEIAPAVLDRDGLVVVADPRDFAAERRATIRTARGTFLLATPAEESVARDDPAGYCADVEARRRAAALFHYLRALPPGEDDPRVRVLGAADRLLLDSLKDRAGVDATEEADVAVEHPLAVGIVEDGSLLAIASLLEEENDTVDVGVLVDPAQRRRGLGAEVVRELAQRAVSTGNLVQYRCDVDNAASAGVARACGFALWGVLTVAAQPDPAS
jgi:predicted GNAT family acetyltransferase